MVVSLDWWVQPHWHPSLVYWEDNTVAVRLKFNLRYELTSIVLNSDGIVLLIEFNDGGIFHTAKFYSNNKEPVPKEDAYRYGKKFLDLMPEDKSILKLKYNIDISFLELVPCDNNKGYTYSNDILNDLIYNLAKTELNSHNSNRYTHKKLAKFMNSLKSSQHENNH